MITTIQFEAIKKYLGSQYSPKIIAHLDRKKIYNSNAESYKPSSIQKIAKGEQENLQVEKEIFNLIDKLKKAAAKEFIKRKEILKK
jgi:hypothetical protein